MVEADRHFEHIDMLSMGIQYQPYTVNRNIAIRVQAGGKNSPPIDFNTIPT
jgi:hypothetical protein